MVFIHAVRQYLEMIITTFFKENICSIEDADSLYRITETIALLLVVYALLQNLHDLYADNLVNVE